LNHINKIESLKLVKIADLQLAYYSNKLVNTRYCAPVKVYESLLLKTPFYVNENYGIKSLSIKKQVNFYKDFQDLYKILKNFKEYKKPNYSYRFDSYNKLISKIIKN
jgi:hypothetical protein